MSEDGLREPSIVLTIRREEKLNKNDYCLYLPTNSAPSPLCCDGNDNFRIEPRDRHMTTFDADVVSSKLAR